MWLSLVCTESNQCLCVLMVFFDMTFIYFYHLILMDVSFSESWERKVVSHGLFLVGHPDSTTFQLPLWQLRSPKSFFSVDSICFFGAVICTSTCNLE